MNAMTRAQRLCPLIVVALLGCSDEDCGRVAVTSVHVTVSSSTGEAVTDASVTYTTESQGEGPCDLMQEVFACGVELSGPIAISAVRGDSRGTGTVTVPRGECNVRTQALEVQLSDGASAALH